MINAEILPAKRLMGQGVVMLSPHSEESVHERYKEAWKLRDSRKRASVRAAKTAADKIPGVRAKAAAL